MTKYNKMSPKVRDFIEKVDAFDKEIWELKHKLKQIGEWIYIIDSSSPEFAPCEEWKNLNREECFVVAHQMKSELQEKQDKRLHFLTKRMASKCFLIKFDTFRSQGYGRSNDFCYRLHLTFDKEGLNQIQETMTKEECAEVAVEIAHAELLVTRDERAPFIFKQAKPIKPRRIHRDKSLEAFRSGIYKWGREGIKFDTRSYEDICLEFTAAEVIELRDKAYRLDKNGERKVVSPRLAETFDIIVECAK